MWDSEASPTPTVRHGATQCEISLSKTEKYFVSSAVDGSICVIPKEEPESFWVGRSHGASASLTARLSFDDAYMVSAGSDGNLFVNRIKDNSPRESMLLPSALPSMEEEVRRGMLQDAAILQSHQKLAEAGGGRWEPPGS